MSAASPTSHESHDARSTDVLQDLRWESSRRLLRSSRGIARYWLSGALVCTVAVLFLPWQQSVQGRGALTALSPADRSQDVPSVVDGAIAEWAVGEGDRVQKGQLLVRLREVKAEYLDPNTAARYREQLSAKRGAITAKQDKINSLREQRAAMVQQRDFASVEAANIVLQYRAALDAAVADSAIAVDQLQRRERLAAEGLSSTNDLQSARLRRQQASAKAVEKANDLANAEIKTRSVLPAYDEKLAKVDADIQGTLSELNESVADVSKMQNALDNFSERVARFEIRAPQDGFIVKALRAGIGEQVKAGEAVVTIQPANPHLAAAVSVKAVDVPLLSIGRKVRLQFDGWPALQFSGWPRVAVGTFGGLVSVIDRVSGADGTFRVLVSPDPDDTPWPDQLRVGSGVYSWAMLDEVRLGYELWRRVNGFPQSLQSSPDAASVKGKP